MTALAPSAVTAPAVATAGVDQDNEARRAVLLAAPAIVILAILFALPLALLLLGSLFGPDGLSVSAYWRLLGDSFYRGVIWNSLRLALMITGLTLLLGYPAAFGLTLFQGAMRSLLLAALFLPLAASVIVKAFAWTILLRSHGILNEIMLALDIVDKPVRMIFTQGALVFGAANIFLPFMILPIYAVVAQIDRRLGEAASTLGASPVEAFLRVTLPLSVPGIVAGVALVFSLSVSAYVVPNLLMGENYPTLASTIAKAFLLARDPTFGAAAGVVLMVIAIIVVVASGILGRPPGGRT